MWLQEISALPLSFGVFCNNIRLVARELVGILRHNTEHFRISRAKQEIFVIDVTFIIFSLLSLFLDECVWCEL